MVHVLKRIALLLAVGGVLGDVVTMLVAPGMLTWFQTPGTGSALCNCVDVSRQTATSLVHAQLGGTAIGAVTLAVVGELLWRVWDARRLRKSLLASKSAAASTPSLQSTAQSEAAVPAPASPTTTP